jgi:hypothetical protein
MWVLVTGVVEMVVAMERLQGRQNTLRWSAEPWPKGKPHKGAGNERTIARGDTRRPDMDTPYFIISAQAAHASSIRFYTGMWMSSYVATSI